MVGTLFASLIFGLIGMAAFGYGKKQGKLTTMLIAALLMVYPYFVSGAVTLWVVGAGLTASLFVFKD